MLQDLILKDMSDFEVVAFQADLTAYLTSISDVPQQEGFPDNIVWPTKPE